MLFSSPEPRTSLTLTVSITSLAVCGLLGLLNRATRRSRYVYETSTYRAVEQGTEFTLAVSIETDEARVHKAALEAISANPKLHIVSQGEGWIRISLNKNLTRAGHWMAVYLRADAGSTTLIIGQAVSNISFQGINWSKRRVLRLLRAIETRLAPIQFRPGLPDSEPSPEATAAPQLPR